MAIPEHLVCCAPLLDRVQRLLRRGRRRDRRRPRATLAPRSPRPLRPGRRCSREAESDRQLLGGPRPRSHTRRGGRPWRSFPPSCTASTSRRRKSVPGYPRCIGGSPLTFIRRPYLRLRERSGAFLEQSRGGGWWAGLIRALGPGLRVHTGYPWPVHDHGLVVARPWRQGRAGEDSGTLPVQRY